MWKLEKPFFKIFSRKFFNKKSNNEEGKHNDKTQTENETEEVKRKSKENQLLFRGLFLEQKQWDK